MEFYKNLYVSESLKKKKDKIINKIYSGKISLSVYIITLAGNPQNHLEFYDSLLHLQKNYKKDSVFIVGLAGCYEEALDIVKQITEETYAYRKDADIRTFIMEQQGSRD